MFRNLYIGWEPLVYIVLTLTSQYDLDALSKASGHSSKFTFESLAGDHINGCKDCKDVNTWVT